MTITKKHEMKTKLNECQKNKHEEKTNKVVKLIPEITHITHEIHSLTLLRQPLLSTTPPLQRITFSMGENRISLFVNCVLSWMCS